MKKLFNLLMIIVLLAVGGYLAVTQIPKLLGNKTSATKGKIVKISGTCLAYLSGEQHQLANQDAIVIEATETFLRANSLSDGTFYLCSNLDVVLGKSEAKAIDSKMSIAPDPMAKYKDGKVVLTGECLSGAGENRSLKVIQGKMGVVISHGYSEKGITISFIADDAEAIDCPANKYRLTKYVDPAESRIKRGDVSKVTGKCMVDIEDPQTKTVKTKIGTFGKMLVQVSDIVYLGDSISSMDGIIVDKGPLSGVVMKCNYKLDANILVEQTKFQVPNSETTDQLQ